ncbi:MAG: TlpA disulfide reductase family protein [Saprospiraceae bacterium]
MRKLFFISFLFFFQSSYGQIPMFETFDSFENQKLSRQSDTAYLYNFWATWCRPCVEELPHFIEFAKKQKDKKVKVIFVSLDAKKDTEKLARFVEKNLKNQTVVHLTDHKYNDWIDRVDPSWSGSIPASLYKRTDKIAFHEKQFDSFNDLNTSWLHFLNNK